MESILTASGPRERRTPLKSEEPGKPLTTRRTVIEFISATATSIGLTIQADYDLNWYPKGVKVSNAKLAAPPLSPHDFHGEWNCTINAQPIPARALTGRAGFAGP